MAGQDPYLLGVGANSAPTLVADGNARGITASGVQPHHGVLAVVLLAVIGLWALDKFGFRFAVTAGKR